MTTGIIKRNGDPRLLLYILTAAIGCFVSLVAAQKTFAQGVSLSPTFTGESVALQINRTGVAPLALCDSGPVQPNGGLSQKSLWDATPFGITGRGFYAMSDGVQGVNHSGSAVTLLDFAAGGHHLVAQYVHVDAYARSEFEAVATSGTTGIVQLSLDGGNIAITSAPNQRITFPGGYLLISEQQISGNGRTTGAITVNALHLVVTGKADVIVCSSRAGVTKPGL